jgi:hypothetical protein
MPHHTASLLKASVTVPTSTNTTPPTPTTADLPIFTGFMTPEEILQYSEVPNFDYHPSTPNSQGMNPGTTTHENIATKLKTSPTDQWQRPLNSDRVEKIGQIYSNWRKMSLMANPVLLGESSHTSGDLASISTPSPKIVGGTVVPDLYEVRFEDNGAKPLWILDGQHRIHGLESSPSQRSQKIPVVFLMKNPKFTMEFLAQVFTEVTTGAQDLEDLHKHWMLYSFGMEPFQNAPPNNRHKAMLAVLELCTIGSIGGTANPFYNNVKFNPYDPTSVGPNNVIYTVKDWTAKIQKDYYDRGGTLPGSDLAKQIVHFFRAAKGLDTSGANSKIFGNNNPHTIIRDYLFQEFLRFCATTAIPATTTQTDWETTLNTGNWSSSSWNLPWIGAGNQSSTAGTWMQPSHRALEHTMNKLFNAPGAFSGNAPSTYLGTKQHITLIAKKRPNLASTSWSTVDEAIISSNGAAYTINSGVDPWSTCNLPRTGVQFYTPASGIMSIISAEWRDSGTPMQSGSLKSLAKKTKTSMLDLAALTSPVTIEVSVCCYSKATIGTYSYTISW